VRPEKGKVEIDDSINKELQPWCELLPTPFPERWGTMELSKLKPGRKTSRESLGKL
jgi:hypothetical protein